MRNKETASRKRLKVIETPEEVRLTTWVQLMRTYLFLQKRVVSILSEHNLTMAQFDVLAALHYGEGLTQQELAAQLFVTKGNVCGLLDRLEETGWVKRRADVSDARANRVYLTSSGRRTIEAALPAHDEYVVKLFSGISVADATVLRELLHRLEESVHPA